MLCPRGFLLIRNMRTGDLAPFFIKVREEDIIWSDGTGPIFASEVPGIGLKNTVSRSSSSGSDIIDTTVTDDGWVFETHSFGNRIYADGRLTVADFSYISTKKEVVVINLPFSVNYKTSSLIVSKITGTESGASDASASEWKPYDLIEESFIEARFINANENELSSQIEIALINPNADFVAEALNNMNMDVCIHISGFTV